MRSGAANSAAVLGGMVNMARGISMTFGIAVVTLDTASDGNPGRACDIRHPRRCCSVRGCSDRP